MAVEKRFLGGASLKGEGDPVAFDEGQPLPPPLTAEEAAALGRGQSMREQDLRDVWLVEGRRWHVVRSKRCNEDINDERAEVWTLSCVPGEPGWETDSGSDGYGLKYAEARELADAANAKAGEKI